MKEQLTRIFNTLLEVNTKGEDTIIMSECLKALRQVINEMPVEQQLTE